MKRQHFLQRVSHFLKDLQPALGRSTHARLDADLLFVLAWRLSRSVEEVAELLGIHPCEVRASARSYRQAGIPLKKHKPVRWWRDFL